MKGQFRQQNETRLTFTAPVQYKSNQTTLSSAEKGGWSHSFIGDHSSFPAFCQSHESAFGGKVGEVFQFREQRGEW